MTYPFLSSYIKESFDGSFFSFVLGLFSSLPNPPSTHFRKSGIGDDKERLLLYYFVCMEMLSKIALVLFQKAQKKRALG